MPLPFELTLAWRYIRAGRRGRRKDRFMSFISATSVASIALGVAALIIVLSVMNGFQKEVRDRMLSALPHIEVSDPRGAIADLVAERQLISSVPGVVATAPFVSGQALLSSGDVVRGAVVRGVDPESEPGVSELARAVGPDGLAALRPESFNVALGTDLARLLGIRVGDRVLLIVSRGSVTPAGFVPRMRQMTVAAVFTSGHYEFDSGLVLMSVADAALLYRTGGPAGIRVRVEDPGRAPLIAARLAALLPDQRVSDWTQQNRTWFAAVQVEKRMMAIILFLIVLVGAFGLVSTLVMTVNEKRADIAVLRTMGASRGSILSVFVAQGAIVAALGVALGLLLGLLIALNLGTIVPAVESLLGAELLPKEIYFISEMPSDPRLGDIVTIAAASFLLSLAATIYPSWRAAQTRPAEVLRYE